MEAAPRVPPGFWPFASKSDIRPAERSAESGVDFAGHEALSIRRFSSAVEQRFCKPKVGSSILSTGTKYLIENHFFQRPILESSGFCFRKVRLNSNFR